MNNESNPTKEAEKFYESERIKGNTDNITENPSPDYAGLFYQEIFALMEAYRKSAQVTKSVSITDEEILGKEITMDKIEVTGCIGCPMLKWDESIIGYWCGAVKGESIDDQIEQGESPTWCPLKKSSITITLITEKCSSDIR